MLNCPICQTPLTLNEKTYRCTHNHSFDIAKEGYVNLHVVQHKKSKNPGDTPEAVQARRRFLAQGFYAPLQRAICQAVQDLGVERVLDIGCGEGYYTQAVAQVAKQVIAIDIAKSAVQIAAKADKAKKVTWAVGTGAILPVADSSVQLCTSFFSPLPKDEMLRVLSDDGYLMMATPAPKHLYAMRQALFGAVIMHQPDKFITTLAPEFELISEQIISSPFELNQTQLKDLIAMTPYAYKAKAEQRQRLEAYPSLSMCAEFCLYIFKKRTQAIAQHLDNFS